MFNDFVISTKTKTHDILEKFFKNCRGFDNFKNFDQNSMQMASLLNVDVENTF